MACRLKFIGQLVPSGSKFPTSTYVMKSAFDVQNYNSFERHVCNKDGCKGHVWPFLKKKHWESHLNDKCPSCDTSRFEVSSKSGRVVISPSSWYIDLKVEEVIKEDFFGSTDWCEAFSRSPRSEEVGSYYGSPEQQRMSREFNKLCVPGGSEFNDPGTSHWELMTDAGQPYKSVQHSTNLIGIRSSCLGVLDKSKMFNQHPVVIVPGPSQPSNQRPYLLRTLDMFRKYGFKGPGIALQGALEPEAHTRIALTGRDNQI
jgi:hypothetical protein